jgi:hypothetical protein
MAWVNRISMNVLAPALIFSALANKDSTSMATGSSDPRGDRRRAGSGTYRLADRAVARRRLPDVRAADDVQQLRQHGAAAGRAAFGPPGLSAMVAVFTISNLLHFTVGAG